MMGSWVREMQEVKKKKECKPIYDGFMG